MMRNGKIARLPYGVREELNRRLRDGKSGPALLKWLNEKRDCLEVLDEEFESRPITKQNLSEWRQGGYIEWVRKEEARERVQVLMEKAADLEKDAGGMAMADRLGTLLSAELAVTIEQLDEIKDPKERWGRLKEIGRELYRLRREDHHARKLRMAEEQYELREKKAERERLLDLQEAVQNKATVASLRGGGRESLRWTDWEIRVRNDLPMPQWWTNPKTAEEWSRLMMPYWREEECKQAPSVHPPPSDSGATRALKSKAKGSRVEGKNDRKSVRPGRTGSHQKSDTVQPGPDKSKSLAKGQIEAPSVQAPEKLQAPSFKIQRRRRMVR